MKLDAEPIQGEPTRYHVTSERDGVEPYLVDLLTYDGNGCCGCDHFKYRLEPILSRGYREMDLLCKHLRCARDRFVHDALRRMAQLEQQEPKLKRATPKRSAKPVESEYWKAIRTGVMPAIWPPIMMTGGELEHFRSSVSNSK